MENKIIVSKMAEIFDRDRTVITKHLKNIFNDGEYQKYLEENKND